MNLNFLNGIKKFYSMKEVFLYVSFFSFIVITDEKKMSRQNEFEKKKE